MLRQNESNWIFTCSAWLSVSLRGPSSESADAPEGSSDTCRTVDSNERQPIYRLYDQRPPRHQASGMIVPVARLASA
jgi:hypothetical protein